MAKKSLKKIFKPNWKIYYNWSSSQVRFPLKMSSNGPCGKLYWVKNIYIEPILNFLTIFQKNYKKCQCKQNFLRLFVKHRGNIYFDGCVQYQREWRLWIGLFGVAYDDIVQRLKSPTRSFLLICAVIRRKNTFLKQ